MRNWFWYAAFGFNLGSGLAWWLVMVHLARRHQARWERWRTREDEQIARWSHVERCAACMAYLNKDNARLAARSWHDDA